MVLTENNIIKTQKENVWSALMSAEVLSRCIPGCQQMTGNPEDGFEATVVQKVGPVKATFRGKVTLSDVLLKESLKLSGEGKGGAAGFAKGEATVNLTEDNNVTTLSYSVKAKVGGKLAQLGSRIIDGFAKKMADQFFENFKATVEGTAITEEK